MKIGILVHSHTGNTYSIAEQLSDKLKVSGHLTTIVKLEPVGGEDTNQIDLSKINFDPKPDLSGYDEMILCAPVRAFSISPVLSAYLNKVDSLQKQKVDLFVTQALPYSWMGGKHAISQMKKLCEVKGATVGKIGIINWNSKKREAMISDVIERFGNR